MFLFYDLRTDTLVSRPGTEELLTDVVFKRGGEKTISIQTGRSAATVQSQSVVGDPSWTVEELAGGFTIWAGFKAKGDYEGSALAVEKTGVWNATTEAYELDIDLNTTALNTALGHDAATGNDVAVIDDAMFEVIYKIGAGAWRRSLNQVTATIHHDVFDGAEGSPSEAADPTDYVLGTGATQITGIQEMLGVNLTDATELTIATGAVTATQGFHTIDTESDAATDDLDTITAAKGTGDELTIYPASGARTVVIKDGTGNITTGTGDITLDEADKWCKLTYNGTNWLAQSNAGSDTQKGWQLIQSQTASASATIDFTDLTTAYAKYKVVFEDVLPATDSTQLRMRVSDDNGSTFESGSVYQYMASARNASTGDVGFNSASATVIPITGNCGTTAGEDGVCGSLETVRPMNATKTKFTWSVTYYDELTYAEHATGGATHNVAIATDGIQFFFTSGNIASGSFHLFGLKDL